MHDSSNTPDDSSLLEGWADEQSDPAFATLVAKYRSLVFGAALRRAGQPELARDVSQQVFSLVASRARLLVGHANIAGWLYRTATQIAARALRGENRRRARHERAVPENSLVEPPLPGGEHERWLPLEHALESLAARDREAIVLHYFQDLSYEEMAMALGIEQPAARQRVSRALSRLGEKLRRLGWTGSVPALLAGAAAWSSSASTVAAAALGTAPVTAPLAFTFSAIMSHTASKITATVAAVAFIPLFLQWNTQTQLQAELAQLPPPPLSTQLVTTAANAAPVDEKALDALRADRLKIERHAAELERLTANADQEVFVSFGSVDEVAQKAARSLRRILDASEAEDKAKAAGKSGPLQTAANGLAAAQAIASLPELFASLKNVRRLETDANKAGRFYATFFGELLEIPPDAREPYQTRFTDWMSRLQSEGLALPQRPKENSGPWDWRRMQAMEKMTDLLLDAPVGAAQRDRLKELLENDSEDSKPGSKEDQAEATQMLDVIFGGAQ